MYENDMFSFFFFCKINFHNINIFEITIYSTDILEVVVHDFYTLMIMNGTDIL